MLEPTKVNTTHIAKDLKLPIVENFKDENEKVIHILAELTARKAELVDRTPFR